MTRVYTTVARCFIFSSTYYFLPNPMIRLYIDNTGAVKYKGLLFNIVCRMCNGGINQFVSYYPHGFNCQKRYSTIGTRSPEPVARFSGQFAAAGSDLWLQ